MISKTLCRHVRKMQRDTADRPLYATRQPPPGAQAGADIWPVRTPIEAKVENCLRVSVDPQPGQAIGSDEVALRTSFSKRSPQRSQRYSYIGTVQSFPSLLSCWAKSP
jgi:hypothetical protein